MAYDKEILKELVHLNKTMHSIDISLGKIAECLDKTVHSIDTSQEFIIRPIKPNFVYLKNEVENHGPEEAKEEKLGDQVREAIRHSRPGGRIR